MTQMIDVSHAVEHGMITYKGLPAPAISDFLSREASRGHYQSGTEFHIGRIEMVANTGTYLDSPFHRYEDGADLAGLPLSSLANLEAVTIRFREDEGKAINASFFAGRELRGKAVIVHTGWAENWGSESYFENHPFLTLDAVELLAQEQVALVGIDSYNIDDTSDLARPALR